MTQTARLVSGKFVSVSRFRLFKLSSRCAAARCKLRCQRLSVVQIPCGLASSCEAVFVTHHAQFVPAENQYDPAFATLTRDALSCRAESLFAAYYFFVRKGYEVTITSVKGGKLPIDPRSVVTPYLTTTVKKGLTDGTLVSPPSFSHSVYKLNSSVRHCPTCAIKPQQQLYCPLQMLHRCNRSIPVHSSVFQAVDVSIAPWAYILVVDADLVMARVNTTACIVYVDGAEFDGVFIVDGLGIMWDGVYNSEIIRVVQESLRAGKKVAAVGHGVAALCNVTDDRGNFIVAGKQVQSFSLAFCPALS